LFTSIIHHRLSFVNSDGFTLIELLVVISILALLMAVLLPTLQRVRRQAKGVACQSNLRQWNVLFSMYLDDHHGRFWDNYPRHEWVWRFERYRLDYSAFALCPIATRYDVKRPAYSAWAIPYYWQTVKMSYGINGWLSYPGSDTLHPDHYWGTRDVKGAPNIPVLFDCGGAEYMPLQPYDWPPPDRPPCEWDGLRSTPCIDRHGEWINILFLDGSIRHVRLKGIWTLKWSRKYDTAGPGTRAGGVQPEDWPEWMRKFKDY